jgi:hypothetical protein
LNGKDGLQERQLIMVLQDNKLIMSHGGIEYIETNRATAEKSKTAEALVCTQTHQNRLNFSLFPPTVTSKKESSYEHSSSQ